MQEPLHFEESLGAVICHRCGYGVVMDSVNSINNHFRRQPHHLRGAALKAVHAQFQQWPVRRSPNVLGPKVEDQPICAIPYLKSEDGWRCRHCDDWLRTDLVNSRTHLRTIHSIARGQEGRDLKRCRLQTVFRESDSFNIFEWLEMKQHTNQRSHQLRLISRRILTHSFLHSAPL